MVRHRLAQRNLIVLGDLLKASDARGGVPWRCICYLRRCTGNKSPAVEKLNPELVTAFHLRFLRAATATGEAATDLQGLEEAMTDGRRSK
nr:hypothetical protein Iba_chr10dCG7280 [Ipomoea batatas]